MPEQEVSTLDPKMIGSEILPCPGCGCEPEVVNYLRDIQTKARRGYHCSCGVMVVDGMVVGASTIWEWR